MIINYNVIIIILTSSNRFTVYKVDKSQTLLPLTLELFGKDEKNAYIISQERTSTMLVNLYLKDSLFFSWNSSTIFSYDIF